MGRWAYDLSTVCGCAFRPRIATCQLPTCITRCDQAYAPAAPFLPPAWVLCLPSWRTMSHGGRPAQDQGDTAPHLHRTGPLCLPPGRSYRSARSIAW